MKNTYPITEEQKKFLSSFTCQRLKDDKDNLSKIQNFISDLNDKLVVHLRCHGWNDDTRGTTAYYVVKNPQGRIMLFFSLKCGTLFDPDYVKRCKSEYSESKEFQDLLKRSISGDEAALKKLADLRREMGDEAYEEHLRELRQEYKKRTEHRCRNSGSYNKWINLICFGNNINFLRFFNIFNSCSPYKHTVGVYTVRSAS